MRLPDYLSRLSPVGETLTAIGAGEQALEQDIAAENSRLSVASADRDGLSLWEADYALEDGTGLPLEVRRAKIRTAMSSAATLTPAYLKELCVTIGGASFGEVVEDFPNWAVQVRPVTQDRVDTDNEILEESIRKLLPAHLSLEIIPCALLTAPDKVFAVLSAAVSEEAQGELNVETRQAWASQPCFAVLSAAVSEEAQGELNAETRQAWAEMARFSVATAAVAYELWGRA